MASIKKLLICFLLITIISDTILDNLNIKSLKVNEHIKRNPIGDKFTKKKEYENEKQFRKKTPNKKRMLSYDFTNANEIISPLNYDITEEDIRINGKITIEGDYIFYVNQYSYYFVFTVFDKVQHTTTNYYFYSFSKISPTSKQSASLDYVYLGNFEFYFQIYCDVDVCPYDDDPTNYVLKSCFLEFIPDNSNIENSTFNIFNTGYPVIPTERYFNPSNFAYSKHYSYTINTLYNCWGNKIVTSILNVYK